MSDKSSINGAWGIVEEAEEKGAGSRGEKFSLLRPMPLLEIGFGY
jgi:hypothetical protein